MIIAHFGGTFGGFTPTGGGGQGYEESERTKAYYRHLKRVRAAEAQGKKWKAVKSLYRAYHRKPRGWCFGGHGGWA